MFEVVRMLDSEGSKRFRNLQVKYLTDLVKLVSKLPVLEHAVDS